MTSALDLREFYETTQGRVVRRVLRQAVRQIWPDVRGLRVAGLGYATPCLRPFMAEAERVVALTPRQFGAVFWPSEGAGRAALCDEDALPLETNSIDRLIVLHTLDGAESLRAVLQEAWRVLAGQGRLILIVPNRAGLWARIDSTPFGHGTPYSAVQLRAALKGNMFVPERLERALFFPPASSSLLLTTAGAWEKLGRRFFNAFGGVNIIEASKQIYAGTPVRAGAEAGRRWASIRPAPSGTGK